MSKKSIKLKCLRSGKNGSAIIETLAGLFILIPVFLLLIDIIALVIAQSINDDIAKQAARYAAQAPAVYNSDGSVNTTSMQSAALAAANQYLEQNCTNYTGSSGIVSNAEVISCTFDPVNGIQIITQIKCDLPVAVPFGGPSSTTFRAQFTEAPVDIQPTPGS
jgi:Flp pilus assembly protein TadG